MKRFSLSCFFLLALAVRAEPVSRDLGHGLAYHRVHHLPGDLPTAEVARRQPCILDLRYVHATPTDAAEVAAWVRFRATARTPVIILANTDTDASILSLFTERSQAPSVIVVGAAAPGFAPDIALKVPRDAEQRAYDAFEAGADILSLLDDAPDKPRNDEASLAREHAADTPPAADSEAGRPAKVAAPPDAVLQRAVQLHRTLVALKKI